MYSLSTQVERGISQSMTCLPVGKLLRYDIWKLCNRLYRQAGKDLKVNTIGNNRI
ncbi:MAG TPA: hypothetical protein VMV32_02825 [Ignavibacteriaceae bacterium]|nr:hypothetical protein [Ignavibacteriaceae bacterium]